MRKPTRWTLLAVVGTTASLAPKVAVTVVTYERPDFLSRCLEQISRQDALSDRVVVVIVDDSRESSRAAVEARLGSRLETFMAPAVVCYDYSTSRRSIGAKRMRALRLSESSGCDVVLNWDDDDCYGEDRLRLQVEPIAAGQADATVATASSWRWEATDEARTMTWGRLGWLLYAVDGGGELGTEILDEALASLCFRVDVASGIEYPDTSYDEDRAFVARLRERGARLRRLPPTRPDYVHVKHVDAAAFGPLSRLYAANLGALSAPWVAAPLAATSVAVASRLVRELLA